MLWSYWSLRSWLLISFMLLMKYSQRKWIAWWMDIGTMLHMVGFDEFVNQIRGVMQKPASPENHETGTLEEPEEARGSCLLQMFLKQVAMILDQRQVWANRLCEVVINAITHSLLQEEGHPHQKPHWYSQTVLGYKRDKLPPSLPPTQRMSRKTKHAKLMEDQWQHSRMLDTASNENDSYMLLHTTQWWHATS